MILGNFVQIFINFWYAVCELRSFDRICAVNFCWNSVDVLIIVSYWIGENYENFTVFMLFGNVVWSFINFGYVVYKLWIFEWNCPVVSSEIQILFELLWAIELDKNYEIFIAELCWCVQVSWKLSWILDVYVRSNTFSIGTALVWSLISVTVLILFWRICLEKNYQNLTIYSSWYWVVSCKILWILVGYAISYEFWV